MDFAQVKPEFQYLYKRWFEQCLLQDHQIRFLPAYGGFLCASCGKLTFDDNFIEWFNNQRKSSAEPEAAV